MFSAKQLWKLAAAIRIDTIWQVVIIVTVGKIGNPFLFQPLESQGDWRKIDLVTKRQIKDELGSQPLFGKG